MLSYTFLECRSARTLDDKKDYGKSKRNDYLHSTAE